MGKASVDSPPIGSLSAGNKSPPQILQAATAVTMPANPEGKNVRTLLQPISESST